MKKIYLVPLFALSASSLMAGGKIDFASNAILHEYNNGTLDKETAQKLFFENPSRGGSPIVKVLVETDGSLPADMPYNCYRVAGNFYTVDIPVDDVQMFSENEEVLTMSFGNLAEPQMDIARGQGFGDVDRVHTGTGLGENRLSPARPYLGTGVIAGAFDQGFDPSHVNWLNVAGNANRLKYYVRANSNGVFFEYAENQAVEAPSDAENETHATHVVGIMAGAYRGSGKYYGANEIEKNTISLYGVAPEAELAVGAASRLLTTSILEGVSRIANYANEQNKPVVINLSLGNNLGPHDGNGSTSRALDKIVDETGAIIVVSAGNEGDNMVHAGKTLSAGDRSVTILFQDNAAISDYDIWSSSSAPFKLSLAAYNTKTGRISAKVSCVDGKTVEVGKGDDVDNSFFRQYFGGSATIQAGLGQENRYHVYVKAANMKGTANADAGQVNGRKEYPFMLALTVEGDPGVRIDAYSTTGGMFASKADFLSIGDIQGLVDADVNGSINEMATGKRVISVGSYNTRVNWVDLYGMSYSYTDKPRVNDISSFSSWGDLVDGRKLPHVCAPGQLIVSSVSGYWVRGGHNSAGELMASTTANKRVHYWAGMQGTSMSSPFVAGVIALWLEADPGLTVEQAIEIINKTSAKNGLVTSETKWGAGKIKAYDGIKEAKVLATSGIGNIAVAEDDDFDFSVAEGSVEVFAAGASSVKVELYTVGGVLAAAAEAAGDTAVLSTAGLARGIYIVRASDGRRTASRKLAL